MKQSNSNRGMYIEKLIDNSSFYYFEQNILLIEKKHIPFFFSKSIDNNLSGTIRKSTTDYYGVYQGFYFDFEVKQTNNDFLLISQIKKHQLHYLKTVHQFGAISFLLVHFFNHDQIFVIGIIQLLQLIQESKKITIEYCKNNFYEAKVIFPGIINFESLIIQMKK